MIMNRLALIAATGFFALALTACGEHGNSKPTASDTTTVQQQGAAPQQPQQQEQPQGHEH